MAARTPATAMTQIDVAPNNIRPNPRNPRKEFPRPSLERLIDSIEKIGVLVPVTVYKDPNKESEYVLLDGERRWRAACEINRPTIPAWVIAKPTEAENAVRMFNIHMLRDDWDEMETAWALKQIMDETGMEDDTELQKLTGLSKDRIANMKRALRFPKDIQEAVHNGDKPYQLLVEMDKGVLSPARRQTSDETRKRVFKKPVAEIRDIFLRKYDTGAYKDVVDLRKVSALIREAAKAGRTARRAQKALDDLVSNEERTIDDAYEAGAPGSLEYPKILRDLRNLPERLMAIQTMSLSKAAKRDLSVALVASRTACQDALKFLRSGSA